MALFGKILTILNLLAAIGFLTLAAMNYGARQNWAQAGFRHEVAIFGLPLDDQDDSWRPGNALVKDLKPKLLDAIFQQSGRPAVRTQLEAVNEAKRQALEFIDSEKNQRKAIAAVTLPLMTNAHRREEMLAFVKTKPIADLRELAGSFFDDVAKKIQSNVSAASKRAAVADLLYNFNPNVEPKLREWTEAVIGLEQYVAAANRQANNLVAIAQRLEQIVKEDNAIFVRQFQDLLPRLQLLNEQLKADTDRLEQQKKVLEQHNLLYTARKVERDQLVNELAKARDLSGVETANLAAVQKQLFELQRSIADARAENDKLEAQIRSREARN